MLTLDADNPSTLDFSGVDMVFIIPSNHENRVEQVRNYVDACRRDGVKYVLLLSVLGAESRGTLFARQFRDMELALQNSGMFFDFHLLICRAMNFYGLTYFYTTGIPCTFLRCGFFTENMFLQADKVSCTILSF